MRLHAPGVARHARPGQFVHILPEARWRLRRPISLMLADPDKGWVDILFKVVGEGTRSLAGHREGDELRLCGPVGRPFPLDALRGKRVACVGGGVGIPPMIFAADRLRAMGEKVVVFAGSEQPFPFALRASAFLLPGIPPQAMMSIRSLEERGIPCRLASNNPDLFGCYAGHVPALFEEWLRALPENERKDVVLLACGPHPMLAALAALAERDGLPAWVSVEEFMACGVGGCAGCVVRVRENGRECYRRVCVDGPVFDARQLVWR